MKASHKDFTSVVGLLIKAGHVGLKLSLPKGVGSILKAKRDYIWFPSLQIIVSVDTNSTLQIRQDGEGSWFYRKGRKNAYYAFDDKTGGKEFIAMISPHYTKFINDMMIGGSDVPVAEGRSLQSGNGPQAT